ncbi:MAG: DUF4136 domain-containing protein [Cytophagales bacterium]|jgi:hypothetical protein|nr:DUF4136 domain-containing protein [Cytophagales bacterium]
MKPLLCALCIAALLFGCAPAIYSDQDSGADFSRYKTFAWYAKPPQGFKNQKFDNQIVESNVKNYASAELKARGFTVQVDTPDVLLDYEVNVAHKTEQVSNPVYSHPYNYTYYNPATRSYGLATAPSYVMGYQTQNVPYEEGTLTIVMIDRRTNRLVWKGWSDGTVSDEQTYESELLSDIHRIFKKFPVAAPKRK